MSRWSSIALGSVIGFALFAWLGMTWITCIAVFVIGLILGATADDGDGSK